MATYLTEQDVQDYGTDLINLTQRSALHAVAPALQEIQQQNAELQRRLAIEARRNLDQRVAAAVPDYQQIDRDPRWHSWISGVDVLTGRARQVLLNDAVASGDASRIAAFFRTFQQKAGSTQQASAPSRARSAPSGRPTYTREQIGQLYEANRKGAYVGREAEWARIENDIFAAQREGRVQGLPYLTK